MKEDALKFVDKRSIMYVLGTLFNEPSLLEQGDKYHLAGVDFTERFHKILYGSIVNLYAEGFKKISAIDVDTYLSNRPELYKNFTDNKGVEYIDSITQIGDPQKFEYYYNRIKKMTLLRMYNDYGIDIRWIYNPDTLDFKVKQHQEDWLDSHTPVEIVDAVSEHIQKAIDESELTENEPAVQAGEGLEDLIKGLKTSPEVGVGLYGGLINTVTRGARLKKLYLRSAATGVGKSRMAVADMSYISCSEMYDIYTQKWIPCSGANEPVAFITTELEVSEIQTMIVAFISGVDEDHILNGTYNFGEWERVLKANEIIKKANFYIKEMPDFGISDIESTVRSLVRDCGVKYIAFDYIHTSMKIMEEITKRTGGVRLREDQILLMLVIRLKDICNELGIFIETSTQLNGEWEDKKIANQNLLRGAKSIADKVDFGAIVLETTEEDLDCLRPVLMTIETATPTHCYHVFKNRRSPYKSIRVWCTGNLGLCRMEPLFVTKNNYELIPVRETIIEVEDEE